MQKIYLVMDKEIVSEEIKYPAAILPYMKCYPKERCFYVTGDGLVFLGREHKAAISHQKGLKNGELQTIKVK